MSIDNLLVMLLLIPPMFVGVYHLGLWLSSKIESEDSPGLQSGSSDHQP